MEKIQETVDFINSKTNNFKPRFAVILGSGLGCFCDGLDGINIPYEIIPNFAQSTVEGHKGELFFTKIDNKDTVVMKGRFHYYEGYSMDEIIYPIRVFKELGVEYLFITNAAGATNKNYKIGDIMMLDDHINFLGANALIGKHDKKGDRFPSMDDIYCDELKNLALNCACDLNIDIIKGVYLAVSGPCYETKAEIKAYRTLGADAVGMSSVPEAIMANYLKMKIAAFSLITNYATGVSKHIPNHQEVLETGQKSGKKLADLIKRMIHKID